MGLSKYVALIAALLLAPVGAMANEPLSVVRQTVDGVIKVLEARQDSTKLSDADRQAIHGAVDGQFDFQEMAKRSLGSIWKEIDKQQRSAFVPLFRDLLEWSYGNRLSEYSGQTVSYGDVKLKDRLALVDTSIDNQGKPIPVRYSLYYDGSEAWFVYDIRIEGVSLVATFRSDFKTIYNKEGFDGLLAKLDEKVKKLKQGNPSS